MKISVFGTGYVGLVTGVCFAEMGNDVICVDVDSQKVAKLKEGVSPIYEPGLEALITQNLKEKRIQFTTDSALAVAESDLLFIAVGTPSDVDGSADLKYVLQVADTIASHMSGYKTIVTKSTVPVGTGRRVRETIEARLAKRNADFSYDIVSNPEFLREGCAIEDCLKPSRVVVGCESERAKEIMTRLYEPFLKNGNPQITMDIPSAEMTKYAANAMLATKISLMNEFSRLCEILGADVENVRKGIGTDFRIGPHFIFPGIGYGGSCFPKDVRALVNMGTQNDQRMEILESVESVNFRQREAFFDKVKKELPGNLSGKKVALWGVAFKPGTDDIREAPSLYIIEELLKLGANVAGYDPVAAKNAIEYFKNTNLTFCDDQYETLRDAECLIIVTEWKSFKEPNFDKIKLLLKNPMIFDGRNLFNLNVMREKGFRYFSVGRPTEKYL